MGWFSTFLGLGSSGVKDIAEGAGDFVEKVSRSTNYIREAITGEPSAERKAEALKHLADLEATAGEWQAKITLAEAQSESLLKSGWRPAVGWACAISIFVYYVPRFILGTLLWTINSWSAGTLLPMPEMGIQDILGLLASLLGLGYMRTMEKSKGVN